MDPLGIRLPNCIIVGGGGGGGGGKFQSLLNNLSYGPTRDPPPKLHNRGGRGGGEGKFQSLSRQKGSTHLLWTLFCS